MKTTADAAPYPLSPMQQGMLVQSLLAADAGVYVQQAVTWFDEPVDLVALRQAWDDVAAQYGVLRCAFRWEGLDGPVQVVHEAIETPYSVLERPASTPDEANRLFEDFLRSDAARAFDLARAPLSRVTVLRFGDEDVRCVWTYHHAIIDGFARAKVTAEVLERYDAIRRGTPLARITERPFSDFIAWVKARPLTSDEAFWRERLAGFTHPTPLPGRVRPEGSHGGSDHDEVLLTVPLETCTRLRELSRKHGFSVNTFVQGAWAVLLNRYGAQEDIVFGATRAGRRTVPREAAEVVGICINTLPVRVRVDERAPLIPWLHELRERERAVGPHEQTPLQEIQRWSGLSADAPLFETVLIFNRHFIVPPEMRETGNGARRRFNLYERLNYPLALQVYDESEVVLRLEYHGDRYDAASAHALLGHLRNLLEDMAGHPEKRVGDLELLSDDERRRILSEWNDTARPFEDEARIDEAIAEQAGRTPERVALVFEDQSLTYAELDERSNRVARRLEGLGVGPDAPVAVCLTRSPDLMVALLAILKAGGAYVPLDPTYPRQRLALMLSDSGARVLVTEQHLLARLPEHAATAVVIDAEWPEIEKLAGEPVAGRAGADDLAYVMYTSGSTGRPKGVMVTHRNVQNFFAGMDERLGTEPGVWLAVTSIAFDISVLELFWTLARGYTVVLQAEPEAPGAALQPRSRHPDKPIEFSLFYFAADEGEGGTERYRLLLEGAKFADAHGFAAVWTPERHFHAFGGLYPNPSVTSAALAAITRRVALRAGSVVIPLHNPIRVAEEWALVDNLSGGRVGISAASGWQDRDFVFAPENYESRRDVMFRDLEVVRRLWRGESVSAKSGTGEEVQIAIRPKPVQPELPVWVTAAGSPSTFTQAGEIGANLLTHLLGQTVEQLEENVRRYREAWQQAGHPGEGTVTLMIHAFLGADMDVVREKVREPFTQYLRTSVSLISQLAQGRGQDIRAAEFTEEDMKALLEHAFERYFRTSALFGTPATCLETVDRLKEVGVDELACLVDFGVDVEDALGALNELAELMSWANPAPESAREGYSLARQIRTHGVTHLQCTPSLAAMLLGGVEHREALGQLRKVLLGGEALPPPLAAELRTVTGAELHNMYGPTETTIWSTTRRLNGEDGSIPIGRPIANTRVFVLDGSRRPVPVGVPGELYIGGEGVTRGYLNRPDLTAEQFVPDPFGDDVRARLYRTGDLVRYRHDGDLEFLGRMDHQVKIRGHRIELGEIEAVAGTHPAVREAVVLAREDVVGDQRLVLYFVPASDEVPAEGALRQFLRERVPEVMVPPHAVALESWPLTPNGKIDRKALPAPAPTRAAERGDAVLPDNELEKTIAEVWCEVLRVERVGATENFFDIGGNSLLTVRVHNRLRTSIGTPVSLTDLFRFPTIRALSRHLADGAGDGVGAAGQQGVDRAAARRAALARRRQRQAGES